MLWLPVAESDGKGAAVFRRYGAIRGLGVEVRLHARKVQAHGNAATKLEYESNDENG